MQIVRDMWVDELGASTTEYALGLGLVLLGTLSVVNAVSDGLFSVGDGFGEVLARTNDIVWPDDRP